MKLLIADDQVSIHKFLDKMIEWEKYGITEVLHACNGKETLELIQSQSPDILILDIKMPVYDGIEVLQKLGSRPHHPKTLILSAYDEFEYAREAMVYGIKHYLLKPIDTGLFVNALQEAILEVRKDTGTLLEAAIMRILQTGGNPEQPETLVNGAHRLGMGPYVAVLIKLPAGYMTELLGRIRPEHEKNVFLPISETDLYIVHCLSREETADQAAQYYKERLVEFRRAYKVDAMFAGISDLQHELRTFPASVVQCQQAVKLGFYTPNSVHRYGRSQFSTQIDITIAAEWADQIIEKLKTGYTKSSLEEFLKHLFERLEQMRLHPDRVRQLCASLMLLLHQKLSLDRKRPLPQPEEFQSIDSFDQVQFKFTAYLMELLHGQADSGQTASTAEVINKIKEQIDSRYDEDLSLQKIAAQFYINRYQLSRLFKQVVGTNYWQYVTSVRMNKAAELLLFTDHKISSIAGMVGFEDESHFSHAFRKHYGIGPRDYRLNNKAQVFSNNSNVRP